MLRNLTLLVTSLFTLSACTTLSDMPVGTTLAELEQQFGNPTISCPAENPNRFVWSMQPMGQKAWGVDTNTQQQLTKATQVLSDSHFALLSEGVWDKDKVWCYFGPPAEKDITPYKGVKMRVWSYRYKQNGVWDSLMYVYFDEENRVKHYHPGPDPLADTEKSLLHFF